MDYTAIGSVVVTGILGIGAVSAFFGKYIPKIMGWVALAKDAVETINDIAEALEPDAAGKVDLTADEIAKIKADTVHFKTQLAVLLGK